MRDAFGGTFMIMIFLVFIMVYICFTAVALSYAKAFKVKNAVIDFLEEWEVTDLGKVPAEKMEELGNFIDTEIVGNNNYNMSGYNICNGYPKIEGNEVIAICEDAGIIIHKENKDKRTTGVYYTVHTFVGWDIGFLSKLSSLNGNNKDPEIGQVTGMWTISGQTRLIVNNIK